MIKNNKNIRIKSIPHPFHTGNFLFNNNDITDVKIHTSITDEKKNHKTQKETRDREKEPTRKRTTTNEQCRPTHLSLTRRPLTGGDSRQAPPGHLALSSHALLSYATMPSR